MLIEYTGQPQLPQGIARLYSTSFLKTFCQLHKVGNVTLPTGFCPPRAKVIKIACRPLVKPVTTYVEFYYKVGKDASKDIFDKLLFLFRHGTQEVFKKHKRYFDIYAFFNEKEQFLDIEYDVFTETKMIKYHSEFFHVTHDNKILARIFNETFVIMKSRMILGKSIMSAEILASTSLMLRLTLLG